ncbi:Cell division cycle protein 123 homolog,Cell division cycle protein 123 [Mytilus coruscus]|uniref:Cell division cycle protein 123 homolog,Cell division cycle protein 123 n=1 Tax=Mytilus coruscus TaxID=42192 RepID=A0A6J8DWS9_MYTCO|nr:Cell division cycle protein 123 homolog,Cell division cycle protein 123 [Mytilus coruscus]
MKVDEVLQCSFPSWYNKFKDITIKSYMIPLPQEFIDYLHADGIVLPAESITASAQESNDDNMEGEEIDVDWDDDDGPIAEEPSFPEFETTIKNKIKSCGGKVFPKLNWSSPQDATWISFDKTLKCTCPSDIYLLLKSSEFITHDLTQPFYKCEDYDEDRSDITVKYHLILRQWQDLNPAAEFRCYVRNNQLLAISQRHHSIYYEHIVDQREDIVADIKSFFYHMVSPKFPCTNYSFDVYRRDKGKLLLIDFNPFGSVTDSLMFTWKELEEAESLESTGTDSADFPAFRCVARPEGVQPSPYATCGVPRDIIDLATGQDPYKLMDLLKLKVQNQNEESSDDDEDTIATPTT